jgi:hypothetical protein
MKIREILQLHEEKEMKMPAIAKEFLPVGEKKLYSILKEIGCVPPKPGHKTWNHENVSEADLEKDISELAQKTAKYRRKPSNSNNVDTSNKTINKTIKNSNNDDIIKNVKEDSRKENDMKAEIQALIKGTSKEENDRIYKGIYFDKDISLFLDNVKHGNKSEIVNMIMRQYLTENDLL